MTSVDRKRASRRLAEPEGGWEEGLALLVLESRCPWCQKQIEDVRAAFDGEMTWNCAGDCNP